MTMFSEVVIVAIHRVDNTKLLFFEDVTGDGVIRFEHTDVLAGDDFVDEQGNVTFQFQIQAILIPLWVL
jgi:hypothetical protein